MLTEEAPALIAPTTRLNSFLAVPEEALWLADFNSERSIVTYKKGIQQFLAFAGVENAEDLKSITHAHVIAFKKHLQAEGKSPRTINNRLSAIGSLFNHLINKQVVKVNPAVGVRRLKVNHERVEAKVLSSEEVRQMLDAPDLRDLQDEEERLQVLRDRAILGILFYTGCRVSEVRHLKVKDFYQEQGYWLLDFQVKGGKRNRLAIHPELQERLKVYLEAFDHHSEADYPLITPIKARADLQGKRHLNRKAIHYVWSKYAKKAGIEGSSPHSARTTFITQALENNCPIEAVQKSVGHSQIKTTQMYDKRTAKYRESASFAVRY